MVKKKKTPFKYFAEKIVDELKKIGITSTIEPSGLGRVEIFITGKK